MRVKHLLYIVIFLSCVSQYTQPLALFFFPFAWGQSGFRFNRPLTISLFLLVLGFALVVTMHALSLQQLGKQVIRYFAPSLCLILTSSFFVKSSSLYGVGAALNSSFRAFRAVLLFYLADVVIRIVNTGGYTMLIFKSGAWDAKAGSILYADLNFHAILSVSILSMSLYIVSLQSKASCVRLGIDNRLLTSLALLSLVTVYLSQSFAGYVAALFVVVSFFLLVRCSPFAKIAALSSFGYPRLVAVVSISLFIALLVYCLNGSFVDLGQLSAFSSSDSKLFIISKAISLLGDWQILLYGVGPQQFQHVGSLDRLHEAHNLIGILSETGLLVLIPLLFLFIILLPRDPVAFLYVFPTVIAYTLALFPLASLSAPLITGMLMNLAYRSHLVSNRISAS
jgi:hypothetical protein